MFCRPAVAVRTRYCFIASTNQPDRQVRAAVVAGAFHRFLGNHPVKNAHATEGAIGIRDVLADLQERSQLVGDFNGAGVLAVYATGQRF